MGYWQAKLDRGVEMAEKIKVLRADVMASDHKHVTYKDGGGTLRRAAASMVEIIEDGAAAPAPQEVSTVDSPAGETSSGPSLGPDESKAPTAPAEESAPPSGTSSVEQPTKPKRASRKKDMATAATTTAAKKKAPPPKAKTAAKKTAPRTESSGIRTIGGKAVNLDGYEKVKSAAGGTSYHNGDAVAEKLAGKTLDEVYDIGAKTLKVDKKALQKQYEHLNSGMQRMSIGNRMRKVLIPKAAKN
jgi:hypothetical protein